MASSPSNRPVSRGPAKTAAKTATKASRVSTAGKGLNKIAPRKPLRAKAPRAKAARADDVRVKAVRFKDARINEGAPKAAAAQARPAKLAVVKKAAAARKPADRKPAVRKPAATARKTPAKIVAPLIDLAARDREIAREATVASVNRSLDLLESLARSGPAPLAALAESAKVGKTAAFDLMTLLQARNFVIRDDAHGLWRLGARWAVLGRVASEQGALAATAMPFLSALGNATGENVYLRVREGMECVTVAIHQSDPGLRIYTDVGAKMPLHAGSGRVLLAHAPETVQTQVLAQRLQRYTPSTRIDPTWIAAELHRIRQRGFLITDSEVVAGTVTVCAPVRDASGQVVAGLLIAAPSLRMRPPRPRGLMPGVVEAAKKLSEALGFAIQQPPATTPPAAETKRLPEPAAAMPAMAMGATMARPHTIFRQV